ncbi:MAG: head-tail connector protein [Rhizobiaceae bacterium]
MVELAEAKRHLRVTFTDDDELIQAKIDAAVDHLSSVDVDMTVDPLPPALHHAVLLLVGHFYVNTAATTDEQLRFTPIGVDRLIAPYRGMSL